MRSLYIHLNVCEVTLLRANQHYLYHVLGCSLLYFLVYWPRNPILIIKAPILPKTLNHEMAHSAKMTNATFGNPESRSELIDLLFGSGALMVWG